MSNVILLNKYKIIEEIGSGSFGKVFKAHSLKNKSEIAIKIQYTDVANVLKNEAKIYKYLKDTMIVPKIKNYGSENSFNFLVLDLLGKNLIDCMSTLSKKEWLTTMVKMIDIMEILHSKKIIHRDIKPDNFVFCREKKELFIIDFGLSIYYNDKDYKNDKIIGSVKYCSLDVHNKKGIYYKDDLESVLYTFLNCYGIDLPWNNLIIKLDKSKLDERNILIDKIKLEKEKICDVLLLQPNILYESIIFIKYCRNLKSKELPNYNYLKGLFNNALKLF
jgi:serine/threonine protein kinase